ncbi:MAG: hypothetical protein AB1505_10430 [Candidatus Latescibacterota bacterium]
MAYVRLVHWKAEETPERVERLQRAGHEAHAALPQGPPFLRELTERPPAALVIDLGRVPSHGRDVALTVRQRASTRRIPLVFVGGEPAKVEAIRTLLPDAVYADWDTVGEAIARALREPPAVPVVPSSVFAPYAGRPLATKLGLRAGTRLRLEHAPAGFRRVLGELPEGARVLGRAAGEADLTVWFTRSLRQLGEEMPGIAAAAACGPVWIAWPKKTPVAPGAGAAGRCSGRPLAAADRPAAPSDLGERQVRGAGLAAGLVDYKICAIDATWSGLLFRRRAPGR